jgi:hypothetical protein
VNIGHSLMVVSFASSASGLLGSKAELGLPPGHQ